MTSPHHHTQSTLLSHTNFSTPISTNIASNMTSSSASNHSSNASSSISISPSTNSAAARKAHHPPLEAIQTQKAQASVTFRPVSSTSTDIEGDALAAAATSSWSGGGLTPYSPFPSHPSQQYHTPPGQQQQRDSVVIMTGYTEPAPHTASTGNGSFPFTPSTLVEGGSVFSPFGVGGSGYRDYQGQDGGHFQTVPLSPTRPEQTHAFRSATASPDLQHHHHQQLQQRPVQLRASSSRRQQQQQQQNTYSGLGTGAGADTSTNHPRPYSTGSNNINSYYNKYNTFSTSKQQGSQGMDLTYSSSSDDPRFQHLPNLWQVLHRKTQPPVCLFNFYLYMRDDEKSSEEVDFWLDVTAHEVLWRLYVRATKRRMAMAEREMRMERERMDKERAVQEELEMEAYEAELAALAIAHGLEEEKSAHRKQPSVTMDMYEPHWSAANRYLEMSSPEGSSIVDPANITNSTNPSSPTTPKQHHDLTRYYLDEASHSKDPTDQILMVHNALKNPTTQQSLHAGHYPVAANRVQHVRLLGAIPASWAHPSELETQYGTESGISEGTSTGALPPTPAARPNTTANAGVGESSLSAGAVISSHSDAGIAMTEGHPVGTNVTSTTEMTSTTGNTSQGAGTGAGAGTTATPRRAITSGSGGVTKEDLQRSAERIYYKYLIPQAEKRVRIPGAVRQRVALLMDSKMMNNSSEGSGHSPSEGKPASGHGVGLSSPTLKRKNNLGSPTVSKQGMLPLSQSDQINEKSNGSSVSEPAPLRLPSPPSKKDKHLKHQHSSTSLQQRSNMAGPNSGLQQPDQDLGLVFAEAREIVFEGMESYYFPRFLKARAYGNMVPSHRLLRVVLGLFFLFIGFAILLSLIFLNVRPRSLRAWALIPIFMGSFLCTTFQLNICPIMVAMGVSETKWMQFAKVKEPYLMKLHRRRGAKVVAVAVLYTICVGLVFGLVPGHRL